MKKLFLFFLAAALLLGCLTGCGGKNDPEPDDGYRETDAPVELPTAQQVEDQLRLDAYPASSELMTLIGQSVAFSDISVTENTVTFTITAPHFGEALIAWYDSLDTMGENDLYIQISALVQDEPVSTPLTLSYTRQGGQLLFAYTDEYLNLAGCGVREYFNHIYSSLLDEMEVPQ